MEDVVRAHQLWVHLEATDDAEAPFVWWAEVVDEMPGFSAAANTLADLIRGATAAVTEIAGHDVELCFMLAPSQERDAAGDSDRTLNERQPAPRSVSVITSTVAA
jgi:hypothetical protein